MFGISKQAYYQRIEADKHKQRAQQLVLDKVAEIRKMMPQTGTRKLLELLKPVLHQNNIKMGRDALFELLRYKGLLVRRTRRFHITTDSNHFYYTSPNLIKDMQITHAEQVFVNDITYVKTDEGHGYLALVTDAYSKKIMGWSFDNNMKVSMVKQALAMAHGNCMFNHPTIIHHSDRGKQYCCPDYTEFAAKKSFVMSTTQQSDPYENAVAERVNGILKYEFGLRKTIATVAIARKMIKEAVAIYNNDRLHWSLDLKTPQNVHTSYNIQKYKSYKRDAA